MFLRDVYYLVKPAVPRPVRTTLRSSLAGGCGAAPPAAGGSKAADTGRLVAGLVESDSRSC
jgi:hypothetical protein